MKNTKKQLLTLKDHLISIPWNSPRILKEMKGKRNTAELRMMNMKRLPLIGLIIAFIYYLFYRTLDRKAVDMLSAKVKEKA